MNGASRHLRLLRIRVAKVLTLLRYPSLWHGLRHGVLASVEHSSVPFGSGFQTVVDVGSSRGQFALFASQRFPLAALYCFEPLASSVATLSGLMGDRVTVTQAAVGSSPGAMTLHVAEADDASSLLPIGSRQQAEFPGSVESSLMQVDVVRLDDAVSRPLQRPALLKIDVQGFELEVLRGATALLNEIDEVFVECSYVELYVGQALAEEVTDLLAGSGFELVGSFGTVTSQDGQPLQADLLFRRTRSAGSNV